MYKKLDLKNTKTIKSKQLYFKLNRNKKHDKLNDWGVISHRSNKDKKLLFKDSFLNNEIFETNVGINSLYDLDK